MTSKLPEQRMSRKTKLLTLPKDFFLFEGTIPDERFRKHVYKICLVKKDGTRSRWVDAQLNGPFPLKSATYKDEVYYCCRKPIIDLTELHNEVFKLALELEHAVTMLHRSETPEDKLTWESSVEYGKRQLVTAVRDYRAAGGK